ncbi:MAG: hypothetical protein KKA19_06990, partial [Candidatus Margulisbacteria bacterium]|nr:hypothetical protein [Candidatus Margulisiibacteriota bacterium]
LKENKNGVKEIDLRPRVKMLKINQNNENQNDLVIEMQLTTGTAGSAKYEEVLKALNIEYKIAQPHRKKLYFNDEKNNYYLP